MKRKIVICVILFAFLFLGDGLKVSAFESKIDNVVVNIFVNGKEYSYSKNDNLYKGNNFEIKHNEYERNRQIVNIGNRQLILKLLSINKSEDYILSYLLPKFDDFILNIKKENEILPIDAKAEFTNSDKIFSYSNDKSGLMIDNQSLNASLLHALAEDRKEITLTANMIEKKAEISLYDVKQVTCLRSKESTSFANSEEGRRHNLIKAMSAFNGLVVQPGEKVSFNQVTGDKTYEKGYKDAMVILNGEFVKGVGGGVCQASTTIYNAALMAGLEICKVQRHSLPVYYVPAGFDAMVSEYSDMVFRNNTEHPIYFRTYTSSERVYAEVYGESMKGVSYKKVSTKIRDIETTEDIIKRDTEGKYVDKIKYKGEFYRVRSPKKGFEVNAYLQKYCDGKLVCEELIRNEIYAAQKGVVYEGTMEKSDENIECESA